MILPILLALGVWAFVSLSLWLNPPLRSKPAQPGREVTISGRPVEILPLEQFRVTVHPPCEECEWQLNKGPCFHARQPVPFSPIVDLYTTVLLEGLLLRGICDPSDNDQARQRLERDVYSKWLQAGGVAEGLNWRPGKLDVSLGGGFTAATHNYWYKMPIPSSRPVFGRQRKEPVYA